MIDIFHKDRSSSGGGVFMAVRNDLVVLEERRLDVKGSEVITVSVQFDKTKKLYFTSYYRPPTQDRCSLDPWDDVLGKLCNIRSGYPHTILCGDFNCCAIDWCSGHLYSDTPVHACDYALLEIADKFGLIQHVKSPTRPDSGRTLDLVFSTTNNLIQAYLVINYSQLKIKVHFTLVYWFKSRTWQSQSNRACAKVTWKPENNKHGG